MEKTSSEVAYSCLGKVHTYRTKGKDAPEDSWSLLKYSVPFFLLFWNISVSEERITSGAALHVLALWSQYRISFWLDYICYDLEQKQEIKFSKWIIYNDFIIPQKCNALVFNLVLTIMYFLFVSLWCFVSFQ